VPSADCFANSACLVRGGESEIIDMSTVDRTILEAPATPSARPRDVDSPPNGAHRRGLNSILILTAAALGVAALGFYLYLPGLYEVGTDDAYVDAHMVSVVPKVAAYVSVLHVNDNAKIKQGDLLVELDPRDFQVAVDSAAADLKSAEANAANNDAQLKEQQAVIVQSEAAVAGDRAALEFAQQELQRYGSLADKGFGTEQRLQQAQSDIGQRQAALRRDIAALDAARAHVAVIEAEGQQARAAIARQRAALAQAELNLSYTKIYAVETGTVANKTVEVGNFVQPGQVLFSTVPGSVFVTANYKETQLTNVRPGQEVIVRIDAFPGLRLRAHVDSIQRGTGSQFALLPPENATGNFVKVVQRIPVKVTFDDPGEAMQWIAPGMSVETTIVISQRPSWLSWVP
jgi:membrane fusion protein (multidrug efflux system)